MTQPIIEKGDRVLAVHPIFGCVEGVFIGWGIQDDGTRYSALVDAAGRRREIPMIHANGIESDFRFHLLK